MFAKQIGAIKPEHFPNSTQRLEYRPQNFRRFGKLYSICLLKLFGLTVILLAVADKDIKPTKDYDDYAKYINDTSPERK